MAHRLLHMSSGSTFHLHQNEEPPNVCRCTVSACCFCEGILLLTIFGRIQGLRNAEIETIRAPNRDSGHLHTCATHVYLEDEARKPANPDPCHQCVISIIGQSSDLIYIVLRAMARALLLRHEPLLTRAAK